MPTTIANVPVIEQLEDATGLLADPAALRARAERDGYLYFRGLLPPDLLLQLRRQLLAIIGSYGWLQQGSDAIDGIADMEAVAAIDPADLAFCSLGIPREAYVRAQKLELFHTIPHHPQLVRLYETLFGEEVLVHPRHIARMMLPAPSFTPTPAHQDFTHIQGTRTFWTCWMPLGDVPLALGGLCVLEGSHRDGIYRYASHSGAGNLESIICETEHVWRTAPMQLGDVLTFHSHTVHKANPNRMPGRIRLSCDLRYQPVSMEINHKSLEVHCNVTTWEDVYQGWQSERYQYYWKQRELLPSEWDSSLVQTHRKIC